MKRVHLLAALLLPLSAGAEQPAGVEPIAWQPWSDAVFKQARAEHKFVLLDLEALWCHWCHVMDATTYQDPAVAGLVAQSYLAVKVDEDSRPDLARRYEDYGWPATVIYGPDGVEIVKKQGYIEPAAFARLLRAVVADPSPVDYEDSGPEPPAASETVLSPERRAALFRQWGAGYDEKSGGWGFSHKYLDADSVELALRLAAGGDKEAARRAKETLRLGLRLLDPVWGGVYQYSVGGYWDEPHYEKILSMEADNLRIYSLAYAQWGDPAYLAAARSIRGYLEKFLLSPKGPFFTSQDADPPDGEAGAAYFALDNAGRRARGVPRVDANAYAQDNGWAIAALAELAAVSGDKAAAREAGDAAWWMRNHRIIVRGEGFRHGDHDSAGPYLGDTLAMGQAFYALYELTAYPPWLEHAAQAGQFIRKHFSRGSSPGFASTDTTRPAFPAPAPEFDENVALARFASLLAFATGDATCRAMASSALRWLLTPGIAERRGYYVAGLLLAEEEARTDPVHVAIVGGRRDPTCAELYAEAIRIPTTHKLVEWWDPREGLAPRGDDIYPPVGEPAAFVCANGACSEPVYDADALKALLAKRVAEVPSHP